MAEQLLQPGDCLIGFDGSEELELIPGGFMGLLTAVLETQSICIHELEKRIAVLESDLGNQKRLAMKKKFVVGLQ
jgi:hypothetical protein